MALVVLAIATLVPRKERERKKNTKEDPCDINKALFCFLWYFLIFPTPRFPCLVWVQLFMEFQTKNSLKFSIS